MSTGRLIGINLAMWTLGLASLCLFTTAVWWLDGKAVQPPADLQVAAAPADARPLAGLTAGTARSAATARQHLQGGEASAAAHAIDASHRAAEVGHETSHGPVKQAFTVALHAIVQAREALHEGNAGQAGPHLQEAVTVLEGVVTGAGEIDAGVPPQAVWSGYDGAVLINANGTKLGEVKGIEGGGQSPTVTVHVGGGNDVAGIFELGGRTVRIPADRLLWGARRSLGATYVAAPTEQTSVDELSTG